MLKVQVASFRTGERVVGRAFAALGPDDDGRTVGCEHSRDGRVEEVEIEEVGIEVHDRVALGGEKPVSQCAPVVGFGAVLDAHLGELVAAMSSAIASCAVGRTVLDDDNSNDSSRSRSPSTTARTEDSRISASLNAGITTETCGAVMGVEVP